MQLDSTEVPGPGTKVRFVYQHECATTTTNVVTKVVHNTRFWAALPIGQGNLDSHDRRPREGVVLLGKLTIAMVAAGAMLTGIQSTAFADDPTPLWFTCNPQAEGDRCCLNWADTQSHDNVVYRCIDDPVNPGWQKAIQVLL